MVARISLYRLLARLFRAPPDAELLATLHTLPDLSPYLPSDVSDEVRANARTSSPTTSRTPAYRNNDEVSTNARTSSPATSRIEEKLWLEQAAVAHYQLFGMTVYLYESLYRDHDLMVNTESAQQVAAIYESCQFEFKDDLGAPDHLSHELEFVAALLETRVQAAQAGDDVSVQWAVQQREQFLQQHLAYWVPIAVSAMRRVESLPLYQIMAEVMVDLVLSEAPEGVTDNLIPSPVTVTPPQEEQSLGWLVRQLLTPSVVGLFLTRVDIERLARSHELPVSKGDRVTMLRSLLESAAHFEQLPALLVTMSTFWEAAATELVELTERFPLYPPLAALWQSRLQAGQALLQKMQLVISS